MVIVAVVAQLVLSPPPPLDAVRAALQAGDTTAAVARIIPMVPPTASTVTPEGLAALALLQWIGRSQAQDTAVAVWERAAAVRRRDLRRTGAVWDAGELAWFILQRLEKGEPDDAIWQTSGAGPARAPWQSRLTGRADPLDGAHALRGAGLRWVAAMGWLALLHRAAREVPAAPELPAGCRMGCTLRRPAPADLELLTQLRSRGSGPALDSLWVLLNQLRSSPWPYNEFEERLRVTVCALLRLNEHEFDCSPEGRRLDPVVAAEVRAVHEAFTGHTGLAYRAMDAAPERFAALDGVLGSLLEGTAPLAASAARGRDRLQRGVRPRPPRRKPAPATFWRLAWPLYLMPYNERLVVHRTRLLLADMARRFAIGPDNGPLFFAYGDPGMLIRIGVPVALARAPETRVPTVPLVTWIPLGMHETIVHRSAGAENVPLDLALAARSTTNPNAFSGFVAEDYDRFGALAHQVVQYVRNGRREVDVYTAWLPPVGCQQPRPLMGFFLLDPSLRELSKAIEPNPVDHPRKRFHLVLAPGAYVYSLELLDRSCRMAERARYVLRVPSADDAQLSDLMLADELYYGDDDRTALRVIDRMPATIRPSLTITAGETVRFYWEVYGVPADSLEANRLTVQFEVVNVREERVAVRQLGQVAERARRGRGALDVAYGFTVPPGDGPLGMGLAVGIPEGTRGVHVARLRVTDTRTKQTYTAERAFFVRG